MKQIMKKITLCLMVGIGWGALLLPPNQAFALAKKMTIQGYLFYRSGQRGKPFTWRLRLYENTGIVLGSGKDRDGYAEFFGTYNRFTKRFRMVKHFKYRRSGRKKFYYQGRLRRGRLAGSAHMFSFWGRRYAFWSATISYSRLRFTLGTPERMALRGKLRYHSGRSKRFYWKLRYYRSSGRCFGTVSDRDGSATFEGVYDRPTKRLFLRKKYRDGRTFYYRGWKLSNSYFGSASKHSFTNKTTYGTWTARLLWSWEGHAPPGPAPVPAPKPVAPLTKKFFLKGKIRYIGGGSKKFSWNLRVYPRSGLCFGETYDRDGKALFRGTCNIRTGRLRLKKTFTRRRSNRNYYYTGRITRNGASGVARRWGYSGRIYGTWRARIVGEIH